MGLNILSLFDGISTGKYCFEDLGLPVDNYWAYEIDKPAITCSQARWGDAVQECGDVFTADFAQYAGKTDFLLSGFVCTFFSSAQVKNKESVPETGPGWDLFMQTIRAMHEAKPKYILFENVASMTKDMMLGISKRVGFEPIMIDSARVSAQTRKRYYWVGRRNEDGTYSRVDVEQPEDLGILLKDILETTGEVDRDKAHCLKHQCGNARDYFVKNHTQIVFEAVGVGFRGRIEPEDGKYHHHLETTGEQKANCLTTVPKDSMIAQVVIPDDRRFENISYIQIPNGEPSTSQAFRIYSIDGKGVTLKANGSGCAIPVSEEEAQMLTDRQVSRIYEVRDGKIFIRNKQYPIKRLPDGYYWIRDLTVVECCRLQTLPDDYFYDSEGKLTGSATQIRKMLGNGWTAKVIEHLIKACIAEGNA